MKILTLCLTLYDQSLNELERWLKYFEIIKKKNWSWIELVIICDNPEIDPIYKERAFEYGFDFSIPDFNRKKAWLVENAINEGIITGKYLKICDPDDYIDVDGLYNFYEKNLKDWRETRIIFSDCRTINGGLPLAGIINNFDNANKHFLPATVNYNTIYITEDLNNQHHPNFTIMDDVYNSVLSMKKGRKIYYVKENFYIWNKQNGISHSFFSSDKQNLKNLDNLDYYNEQMNFYNLYTSLENYGENFFPFHNWFIMSVQNSVIASKSIRKYSLKPVFLMRDFFKKFKLIYNQNEHIDKKIIISTYWKTFKGIKVKF